MSRSRSFQGPVLAIKHLQYCICQFFFSGDRLCVLRNLCPTPLFKFSYAFFQQLFSFGFLNFVNPVVHPK